MGQGLILADNSVQYQVKEGAVVVVALVWVLCLASVVVAAWIVCGWRGAKKVDFDWRRMRATFWCR